MRAAALAKRPWRAFLSALPARLPERLLRSWANVVAERSTPEAALRELFALADHVERELDRVAIRYDGGVHVKHRLTRYHDFFVERVREGERVLDAGCGKGELAHDLAERAGAEVTAIDIRARSLAFAGARFAHPRVRFVEADVTHWQPDGRFDVLVLSNVLEHLPHRVDLLRRLVEAAEPSRVLLRVPAGDRHWHVPLRAELGLEHFSDPTHELEYTRAALEDELRQARLEPVEIVSRWGELWAEAHPAR